MDEVDKLIIEVGEAHRQKAQLRYALGVAYLWMPEYADQQEDLNKARAFVEAMMESNRLPKTPDKAQT